MDALVMPVRGERLEFLKWVSERNTHIPLSLLEFLIDTPYVPDEDEFDDLPFEDDWD